MKKDKENIKEPFEPHDTPKPPQIIEPDSGRKREHPVEDKREKEAEPEKQTPEKIDKPHLMSEDADITDETTI